MSEKQQPLIPCSGSTPIALDWKGKCSVSLINNLTPQALCKCIQHTPPEPQACFNIYPKKKKGKKKTSDKLAENSNRTLETQKQIETDQNPLLTSREQTKQSLEKKSREYPEDQKDSNDAFTSNNTKQNKNKSNLIICKPTSIVLDTSPDYYAKVDAQKTTCEFYVNYPNLKIWRCDQPRPPRLIGVPKRHLQCFVNDGDVLYKFIKQKEKIESKTHCI